MPRTQSPRHNVRTMRLSDAENKEMLQIARKNGWNINKTLQFLVTLGMAAIRGTKC